MDTESFIQLVTVVICLVLIAVASATQTALAVLDRARARQYPDMGSGASKDVLAILDRQDLLWPVALVVHHGALVIASAVATLLALRFSPHWSVVAAIFGLILITMAFFELSPRNYAARHPEGVAVALGRLMSAFGRILWPFTWLIRIVAWPATRLITGSKKVYPFGGHEDILTMAEAQEGEAGMHQEERQMINSIFKFGDTVVREVMVPRIDVVAVESTASVGELADIILEAGHTRIPVYQESIDNIIGVVHAKDVLKALRLAKPGMTLKNILRPVNFVPETKKVDELLHELQQKKMHVAIVLDEYGGTAGLVTIEDLLEEIVGEIQDEYDAEPPMVEALSDTEAVVDARLSMDDLNEMLHLEWEAADFDTLGGFVQDQLGKIPEEGDQLAVDGVTITVLSTEGRRLKKVKIERREEDERAEESEGAK